MPIFTLRTGATGHPEDSVLQTITDQIDASGVYSLVGNDFKAQAQATPDLTVKVIKGRAYIEAPSGNSYPIRADSDSNVSVPANSSGNPRIDALVLFIDLSAAPNTDASNVAKLQVVQGIPAPLPSAPTDGTIQTEIGASNPFLRLANITVASGATSITNANIADTRVEVIYIVGGVRNQKGFLDIKEQASSPATPPSGRVAIYAKADHKVYKKTDAGAESEIGTGGGGATTLVQGEVPAGTVNGVNTVFTTAAAFVTGSLRVYKNGIRLKGGGADYTENIQGFTMVTPPATGTVLLCDYNTQSGVTASDASSFIYNETPAGAVNGVNKTFTAAFPYIGGTLQVFRDGQKMKPGASNDYTETNPATGVFDFYTAPVTGSVIDVSYMKSLAVSGNSDTVDGFHANSTPTPNQIPVLDGTGKLPSSVLSSQPACQVYHNANQSVPHDASGATLAFNSEDIDTDSMHNPVTNNSRITINTPGLYLVGYKIRYAGIAGGERTIQIFKNGSTARGSFSEAAPNGTAPISVECELLMQLAANDFLECVAYQTSGGALNVLGDSSDETSIFWAVRISG